MADLTDLTDAVAENTSVIGSAEELLTRLADELDAANGDQATIDGIVEQIRADASGLAGAVAENTPAAEEPTDGEPPAEPADGEAFDPDAPRPA